MKIHWMDEPEEHDYPAARSYLTLLMEEHWAEQTTTKLHKADMSEFKAKDIFRASHLPLLGLSNTHIKHNLEKIKAGEKLSPLLLVRVKGDLFIADGYHRLCAVYSFDEDAMIPCKIVSVD